MTQMPNPVTDTDLVNSIIHVANEGSYGTGNYVIRTLYSQRELEDLTSSQRILFRSALNYMTGIDVMSLEPNEAIPAPRAQTDYYWASRHYEMNTLINIIQNIARSRR
jgi:hypothetical protein